MKFKIYAVLCLLFLSCFVISCGRKTLPVPPKACIPAKPSLAGEITDGILTLTWNLQSCTDGFILYESKTKEKICDGCPAIFKKLEKISRWQKDGSLIVHEVKLDKGFFYLYKVVAYTGNEILGPDSNILKLEY